MVGSDKVKSLLKKKFPSLSSLGSDGNTSFLRAARAGHLDKVLEQLRNNVDINTCNANGLNALHLASKDGHVHVVTELLKRGANVDSATKKGNTALHIASLAGQEEVVRLLVEHGASVNVQSQNGFTPLYMAAQENHDNVVKYLLANGANQSLATEDGFTPLAVAMQQGHDKVVAVLLENDTRGKVRLPALHIAAKKDDCKAAALLLQNEHNPDVTSKSGFTPLHIASHYGNEGIANLLLNKGADVNYAAKHNITPLHVAAKWGKSNMVSLLLEKGANIESKTRDGLTPLHCAARSGHEQVVDMLLERGAPISSKTKNGLAPLHMASQGDHVDAARILLYHRAPVDEVTVDYLTALHVAAHCGHARVAKLLLDRKADPNARALNGFTPLHIACKKNRIKVVELLLKHGASIEATTESGLTPLHVASFMGCMNIVIYLLQNEANPDVPTVRGETPLHLAARANQTDIIRILLRNGAQVDARAREQQTPLHIAARLGNVDIVMLLLQHGAAVDCTTKDLYSALHIAAKEGQDEVAAVLLENGASVTASTKKGFTPLHLAAKYGNMKVARLLLQRDAPVDAQGKNGVTPLHVASHYDHQNVALLLLDKGASPHATAKNGHTPLHIAAKKNQMDIATTLLEYGAKANAESKAGFTPLHLSAQEGHVDMSSLLIDHHADTNHKAKNGLAPLHLCAQEDRVNVATILVKNGAEVDSTTKAGYTPLHVACHFGQLGMVRFLLDSAARADATTAVGYTPLHQAAQQGHCTIVNTLLEHGAPPNATTNQGQTALSIAQKLGYISVVETLKGVTEPATITPQGDEKYKVLSPETMQETFMSDSEDEGGEDTLLSEQPYRYLTVDEMKSLGDDSLPIDVRQDERQDSNRDYMSVPPTAVDDTISPQHHKESYSQFTTPDNIDIGKHPLHVGFLVSFLVDARGGAMRGCRHSGVRVIVPPRRASMPMRVTCRYLRRDKLTHPPPLMEGEALASRILELGPVGAKFLGPVMIEVPHFGSLRNKEREIVILRSDNGETWREHTVDCSEEAVQDVLSHSFDKEDLAQLDDSSRTTRILTSDFPHYFAVVTRVRQEVHAIGPEGGMVSSSVVPQVQAVFPQGALTKKIKVGLQAQPIPAELAAKLLGNRVAVSPIVTVEPRRRKFHKPITLTIPKPQTANKGMINQYSGDAPTLRLLCSITGGTTRAQWEDVTGSTPFTFVNDCVSFTTTVSARFWLMDCRNVGDATKMATELYREAIHVPFMAKFVVFAKRVDPLEARLRIFCMTDDKEDKTLEHQEHFTEVAKSRDVEVLEGKTQYVEFAGNLVPVTKSGEQLQLGFRAFRENRLPFTARVKDPHADPVGRTLFMREGRLPKGEPPQQPICVLNIVLPDEIIPEAPISEHELHKYSFIQDSRGLESYQRVDLRLSDISNLLGEDWVRLAHELSVSPSDINRLKSEHPQSSPQQGLAMLRLWLTQAGNKAQASTLENALQRIGRDDIVQQCVFNVDHSGVQLLKEESQDASIRRSIPYSDKDIMKDSESVEDLSRTQFRKKTDFAEKDDKEEKKYEAEEKEVEEVKKSVSERRKEIEKRLSLEKTIINKTETIIEKSSTGKIEDVSEKEIAEEKRVSSPEEDEPSELSFEQKRLSFEQGKRVIEMKPDKITMKEVKERADERFLAEERKAAETLQEKKFLVDETSIPFDEKRKSFEKSEKEEKIREDKLKEKKEEKKKEELRRDSALFEGVSQGLVKLDAAFAAAPQVQDLLSPKSSKTPPPSPAEFKDLTGTVAWTEDTSAVIPTKVDQSQDWAEKGLPDSTIDASNKEHPHDSLEETEQEHPEDYLTDYNIPSDSTQKVTETINIETREHFVDKVIEKNTKYQFTMAVPNKEVLTEISNVLTSFLDSEKCHSNLAHSPKHTEVPVLVDTEVLSSDETEDCHSKSESDPKSDKSFVGKMSQKFFGVFKKDEKGKHKNKKEKSKKDKLESKKKEKTLNVPEQLPETNLHMVNEPVSEDMDVNINSNLVNLKESNEIHHDITSKSNEQEVKEGIITKSPSLIKNLIEDVSSTKIAEHGKVTDSGKDTDMILSNYEKDDSKSDDTNIKLLDEKSIDDRCIEEISHGKSDETKQGVSITGYSIENTENSKLGALKPINAPEICIGLPRTLLEEGFDAHKSVTKSLDPKTKDLGGLAIDNINDEEINFRITVSELGKNISDSLKQEIGETHENEVIDQDQNEQNAITLSRETAHVIGNANEISEKGTNKALQDVSGSMKQVFGETHENEVIDELKRVEETAIGLTKETENVIRNAKEISEVGTTKSLQYVSGIMKQEELGLSGSIKQVLGETHENEVIDQLKKVEQKAIALTRETAKVIDNSKEISGASTKKALNDVSGSIKHYLDEKESETTEIIGKKSNIIKDKTVSFAVENLKDIETVLENKSEQIKAPFHLTDATIRETEPSKNIPLLQLNKNQSGENKSTLSKSVIDGDKDLSITTIVDKIDQIVGGDQNESDLINNQSNIITASETVKSTNEKIKSCFEGFFGQSNQTEDASRIEINPTLPSEAETKVNPKIEHETTEKFNEEEIVTLPKDPINNDLIGIKDAIYEKEKKEEKHNISLHLNDQMETTNDHSSENITERIENEISKSTHNLDITQSNLPDNSQQSVPFEVKSLTSKLDEIVFQPDIKSESARKYGVSSDSAKTIYDTSDQLQSFGKHITGNRQEGKGEQTVILLKTDTNFPESTSVELSDNKTELKDSLKNSSTPANESQNIKSEGLENIKESVNECLETNKDEFKKSINNIKEGSPNILHALNSNNEKHLPEHVSTSSPSNDETLNNMLIDMLIEQECLKIPTNESSKAEFDQPLTSQTYDDKILEELCELRTVHSFGKIESLISDSKVKEEVEKENPSVKPYVTTPTMQRRKIGGSQRLSREERPTLREISHLSDYSSSDDETSNMYIVTEPIDRTTTRKVSFQVESEDETCIKVSDSNSEPEIDVTEMTPSPVLPFKEELSISSKESTKSLKHKHVPTDAHKGIKKVEQRFERMASETMEADPEANFKADREFQRMVSQLSAEEVDACITQWDDEGMTPSEELDSSNTTIEGELGLENEPLPEASLSSTNPFYSQNTRWIDFEHEIGNIPSSIFWAFDTSIPSVTIQPSDLAIPIQSKKTKGETTGEEAEGAPSPATTRETDEALLELATGLQEHKGSSGGGGPSTK